MKLPAHKTKIVATIGPASRSREVLEKMIRAGLNVARLNFSHGEFEMHAENIRTIREAAGAVGARVAILADLPGPKMRVGDIPDGPVELRAGEPFVLASGQFPGNAERVCTTFEPLPRVVKPGDRLYLNDGLVQLIVERVEGGDVYCRVAVGGLLSSRKGLNLPGIDLGIHAFTERDHECLRFALEQGVDAVSQSFVERAEDLRMVREAAAECGRQPFLVAKIERAGALERYDEILQAADGIMIARGDLGVEVPIENIAVMQKQLIAKANLLAKPVITATQMLESMTHSRLPTRAEATDVANAILDGTDCVMLSGESAVGEYPVESIEMLSRIAAAVEAHRAELPRGPVASGGPDEDPARSTPKAHLARAALRLGNFDAVLVPTLKGTSARVISRMRLPVWTIATGTDETALQSLCFSYGVSPVHFNEEPETWNEPAARLTRDAGLSCRHVLLVAGPSAHQPHANQRIELMSI